MDKRTLTIARVEQACWDGFFDEVRPQTVNELVARSHLSASTVRDALRNATRLGKTTKEVKIMAKDKLRSNREVHQYRSVDAWTPNLIWMVSFIKHERAENEHRRQYGH